MFNCPRCLSTDIRRSRRSGLFDEICFWFARWPYRCNVCKRRFFISRRFLAPHTPVPAQPAPKPDFAFQTHSEKPVAQLVIQAQSHAQLQKMLSTLSKVISTYGATQTSQNPAPAGTRRAPQ